MEEFDNSQMLAFDSPKDQSSFIKVIGVGGGGNNAVNHMYREGIKGVDFIVCNTDLKALNSSPVPNKIALGAGLGAGSKPERAKKAAREKEDEIREALAHNTQMLFITAGMGGGTGTGAAPVIAEIAKSIKLENEENSEILVVAIVTMPFSYEGKQRRMQAQQGIDELRQYVDSILIINNDKLRSFGDFVLTKAFAKADDVLLTAARGIAEIITVNAIVNIDFQDVNTVMEKSGTALMGAGVGKGEGRAMAAIEMASTSVLLNDNDIAGAKNVLLYFSYAPDHEITMDEMTAVTEYLTAKIGGDDANIIWGAGVDENLEDELNITLIATGFEQSDSDLPKHHVLVEEKDETPAQPVVDATPVNPEEPRIVHPVVDEVKVEAPAEPQQVQQAPVVENVVEPAPVQQQDVFGQKETPVQNARRVFVLDTPEVEAEAEEVAEPVRDEISITDDGIQRVVRQAQAPVQAPVFEAPAPAPVAPAQRVEPVVMPNPFANDQQDPAKRAMLRAERIRRINEQLHNNPDGPQMVQDMNPSEINDDIFTMGQHSNQKSTAYTVGASGNIIHNNNFLNDNPD